MRMSRRAVLHGIGGGVEYSYTGTYDSYGDALQGYLVLKTSGTLSIKGKVDLCLVGGGGKGRAGASGYGGGGGAGGFVQNYTAQIFNDTFAVTIGAGSTTQGIAGAQTQVGTLYTANGGNSPTSSRVSVTGRGTSGSGGSTSTDGTNGENGVFPWNDSVNFASYRVSGCGGGGSSTLNDNGSGGTGGGGAGGYYTSGNNNGAAGVANTGGGGGGGYSSKTGSTTGIGGNGGSGVVLVRWGY